jgi:hypothetical protein
MHAQVLEEVYDAVQRAEKLAASTSLAEQARLLRRYVELLRTGRQATAEDFARFGMMPFPAITKPIKIEDLEEALIAYCAPYNDNGRLPVAASF